MGSITQRVVETVVWLHRRRGIDDTQSMCPAVSVLGRALSHGSCRPESEIYRSVVRFPAMYSPVSITAECRLGISGSSAPSPNSAVELTDAATSGPLLCGADDLFEDFTEPQEVFQARGLSDVSACAEACGIGLILLRVRRTENHHGNVAASLASTHCLQDLAARFPGQIKVDDNEVRTIDQRLPIKRSNIINGFLAVVRHAELACEAMLFEGLADESGVGRIVFHQENGTGSARRNSATRLLRGA